MPPGSIKDMRSKNEDDDDYFDDTPSLSPLNSDDLELDMSDDDESPPSSEPERHDHRPPVMNEQEPSTYHTQTRPSYAYSHRQELEDLQARQYWRPDWRMIEPVGTRFDIGDASVLGLFRPRFSSRGLLVYSARSYPPKSSRSRPGLKKWFARRDSSAL